MELFSIFLYTLICFTLLAESLEIENLEVLKGSSIILKCKSTTILPKYWSINNNSIIGLENDSTGIEEDGSVLLHLKNLTYENNGIYYCYSNESITHSPVIVKSYNILVYGPPEPLYFRNSKTKILQVATLECSFSGYPLPEISWNISVTDERYEIKNKHFHNSYSEILTIKNVSIKDNGTFICTAFNSEGTAMKAVHLFVLDRPVLKFDHIVSIGKSNVFLNWTLNNGNLPLWYIIIQYRTNDTNLWSEYNISSHHREIVLNNLTENNSYKFRIYGVNEIGVGEISRDSDWITMLSTEPIFKPLLTIKGTSPNSITVGWNPPPNHISPFIHSYILHGTGSQSVFKKKLSVSITDYVWINLLPFEEYIFQIQACSRYFNVCGPFSDPVIGYTMDGESSAPLNVQVKCLLDNSSLYSSLSVTWDKPYYPRGKIVSYRVFLLMDKLFLTEDNKMIRKDESAFEEVDSKTYELTTSVKPYANYTVQVCAITRIEECGNLSLITHNSKCTVPSTVPNDLPQIYWEKLIMESRKVYKLVLPHISEENGPICCYRLFVVKLQENFMNKDLPLPSDIPVYSYNKVHAEKFLSAAYLAEMFSNNAFQQEIIIGDENLLSNSECEDCFNSSFPIKKIRRVPKHSKDSFITNESNIEDGKLYDENNYTGFLEVIVKGALGQPLSLRSSYFISVESVSKIEAVSTYYNDIILSLVIIFGLLVFFFIVVLFLMIRKSKQLSEDHGLEINFLNSIWYCWQNLRGKHLGYLISQEVIQIPSISRNDLVSTFMNLKKDSDFGFQNEFEQLSDTLYDATTKACDKLENCSKNRYPDIKVFDHTRVILSQIDGDPNSDYINANFVTGYKGRKLFICAQGPLDKTIYDFWRMIWEQKVYNIIMLTNFEEHGKIKCASYWPQEGIIFYGDFQVSCTSEIRFSDFVIRNLLLKKNSIERNINHYHYISWKDFMAPDHPLGVLKFIKKINEDYNSNSGPILVHCSAGVGRTGTFVAIDTLMEELKEDNTVSIFNTICEMRKQRNYLVQSLKQYIFVYRALLEFVQFGFTEIDVKDFRKKWQQLETYNSEGKSCVKEEFEKLSKVMEEKKSSNIALIERNLEKNRYTFSVPYDMNCVILTPLPSCLDATYINASHIQGYDHSIKHIIAQDPLETTINDFWRMIFDQDVKIIVMLSEIGNDDIHCPQYWPDQAEKHVEFLEILLECVKANLEYIERKFSLTNHKTNEVSEVIHFQYLGWSQNDGNIPPTTKTLLKIIQETSNTRSHYFNNNGTILVHCSAGDRSSLFLTVSFIIQQINAEHKIDIFQTVRSLRSQRMYMVQTEDQYKFCYQAIHDYLNIDDRY